MELETNVGSTLNRVNTYMYNTVHTNGKVTLEYTQTQQKQFLVVFLFIKSLSLFIILHFTEPGYKLPGINTLIFGVNFI